MKKMIYTILALLITALPAAGQAPASLIEISDIRVEKRDDQLYLFFTARIDKSATAKGTTFVYAPQVTNGQYLVSFTPIVVQSNRSKILWERHAWAARNHEFYNPAFNTRSGRTLNYHSRVEYQTWMGKADIVAQSITANGQDYHTEQLALATQVTAVPVETSGFHSQGIALQRMVDVFTPSAVTIPIDNKLVSNTQWKEEFKSRVQNKGAELNSRAQQALIAGGSDDIFTPVSTADTISLIFPFVMPANRFEEENVARFYDDERDSALTVYYRINSSSIDTDYAQNRHTLNNLTGSIEIIRESDDAKISRVVITGFSSPDGPIELNDRLAWDRALAVKQYLAEHTGLSSDMITLYNGSADWQGLRVLVERDLSMPGREEVLRIIDHTPVWDSATQTGRNSQLRQLHGGAVYRYMTEHMFPKLRNGAFIRVYYRNENN